MPKLLSYRPMKYRPQVMIPGRKTIICGREYSLFQDAVQWAQGYVRGASESLIPSGSSVRIGSAVFAVIPMPNGQNRLQLLGDARSPGDKVTP